MKRLLPLVAAGMAVTLFSSCQYASYPRRTAATGSLIGAGVGAAIGSFDGNAGTGALIGAAVGGIAGAAYGQNRVRHQLPYAYGGYRNHPALYRYGYPVPRGRVGHYGHPARVRVPVYQPGRFVHPRRGIYYTY